MSTGHIKENGTEEFDAILDDIEKGINLHTDLICPEFFAINQCTPDDGSPTELPDLA